MKENDSKQELTVKGKHTGLSYTDLLYDCPPQYWSRVQKTIVTYIFRTFISDGSVELIFGDGDRTTITAGSGEPRFTVRPPNVFSFIKIFSNPELQMLETYVKGEWTCINCDLVEFIAFLALQERSLLSNWRGAMERIPSLNFLFKQYIMPTKSTRRTHIHYNVAAEFYEKLLNPLMVYSCAFFDDKKDNLQKAQHNKIARIAERAEISDKYANLLDIGCGWGETALHLADKYPKLSIDGISIAEGQINHAKQALKENYPKSQDRVKFSLCDYRLYRPQEENVYDYIISVGMLEHVGKIGYEDFFYHVNRLLKPGGKAVIHSIIRREPGNTNRWIDKNVFPGGYIPLPSEVLNGIETSGLRNLDCYVHEGENYYKTLQCWKFNLLKQYDVMLPLLQYKEQEEQATESPTEESDILEEGQQGKSEMSEISEFRRREFRRWYAYLSAAQSFFLEPLEDGAVCHFVMQKRHAL